MKSATLSLCNSSGMWQTLMLYKWLTSKLRLCKSEISPSTIQTHTHRSDTSPFLLVHTKWSAPHPTPLPESTLPIVTTGISTNQLLPVLDGLQILLLALLGLILLLQIRLDGFVLCVEVTQILRGERKEWAQTLQGLPLLASHDLTYTMRFPP